MRRVHMKQAGQGLSEYLVIVGLIAVASIAAVGFLGGTVRSQVAAVAADIANSGPYEPAASGTTEFSGLSIDVFPDK
jgi:hypothetical protein